MLYVGLKCIRNTTLGNCKTQQFVYILNETVFIHTCSLSRRFLLIQKNYCCTFKHTCKLHFKKVKYTLQEIRGRARQQCGGEEKKH